MHLMLVVFVVGMVAWPIQPAHSEQFQKELTLLKMKIENLEKNDYELKRKIGEMETNEEKMKENLSKMRNEISDMKKNECVMENKLANMETRKKNWNKDEKLKSSKKDPLNNLDKTINREDQNILNAKIYDHEYDNDCCDSLTEKVNDINITIAHITERLNDNTRKIVENQLEIQNNKKEIDTNTKNTANLMQRSDYCASQNAWGTDHQNQVITYDKLILSNNHDIPGADMDIDKGEFTVGAGGIYQIGISMRMVVPNHFISNVFLRLNGVNVPESIMHTYMDGGESHDDFGGRFMMLRLKDGDTLSVYAEELNQNLRDIIFCINLLK